MSNEARQPVDRFARGLMRDELRKLRSVVGRFDDQDSAFMRLNELIKTRTSPFFNAGKRLPENFAIRLQRDIIAFIEKNFQPIASSRYKLRVHGFENVVSTVYGYYYMQPTSHEITKADGTKFDELACEVRSLRLMVDRRRVCVDDFSCMISFTDHTLARLVERGACRERPISYLAEQLPDILCLVPIFTVASLSIDGRSGVMVPTPHGVLVGDFVIASDQMTVNYGFRRRLISDSGGHGMKSLKGLDALQGDRAVQEGKIISIRIQTFLETDSLNNDKTWCRERLLDLTNDYRGLQPEMIGFLTAPEIMLSYDVAIRTKPIFTDFTKIFRDDRWLRANKLTWLMEDDAA